MSGHSKWASIKHKKAIVDARRGQHFTKLARAITVAAREGGGDPDGNADARRSRSRRRATPRCPRTTSSARSPRAPARASTPTQIETVLYEGYGPGGVALLIEALTDNRNRTGADVRHAFSKHGGNLGEPGSVAYLFDKRGRDRRRRHALRRGRPDGRPSTPAPRTSRSTTTSSRSSPSRPTSPRCATRADERRRRDRERRRHPAAASRACRSTRSDAGKLMRLIDTLEEQTTSTRSTPTSTSTRDVLERVAQ